jgi:hypothetical protein
MSMTLTTDEINEVVAEVVENTAKRLRAFCESRGYLADLKRETLVEKLTDFLPNILKGVHDE